MAASLEKAMPRRVDAWISGGFQKNQEKSRISYVSEASTTQYR
jgi:hypothetical protein